MLQGMKILDLTSLLPGPFCTLMLAQLGAEVIKVEPPGGGDPARYMMPELFTFLNQNKKSLTLNLKNEKGKKIFFDLTRRSNVVLEGFRPGVVKRLGIDYEEVKKISPNIIYCSVSGYGQTGPYKDLPGHDINYQGVAGLLSISGTSDSPPNFASGIQVADICGTMIALSGILSAYCFYLQEGKGQYLDVSMTDGTLSWIGPRLCEWGSKGRPDKSDLMPKGSYGVFETKDGKYISLGIIEQHFWENFCRLVEREDLMLEKYSSWKARKKYSNEIQPEIEKIIKERDQKEWMSLFFEYNIPGAPVNYFSDLHSDPHLQFRGLFQNENMEQINVNPFPIRFSDYSYEDFVSPPRLGEHNESILKELHYKEKEIRELEQEKVIAAME